MTFRRFILSVTAVTALLSGCSLPEFSMYSGRQQDWPTQPGAFINTQFALPIYVKSYPNRAYNVIGQLEWFTNRVGVNYVARKAKALGADAMIVMGEQYAGSTTTGAALQPAISIKAGSMRARLA
jgi:hypothetical protein